MYRAGERELTREEKVSKENPKRTVETGLYYYGARYYDPKVSVWLSVDQRAHWYPSTTPYAYVMNNPINLTDPTGMSAVCPDCPNNGGFDMEINSQDFYTYDSETGTTENKGHLLNEATVVDNAGDNYNPQDNTGTSGYNDYANAPESWGEIADGLSTDERTRKANEIDRLSAKYLDPNAFEDLSALEEPAGSLDGDVMQPTWIEDLKEFVDVTSEYENTGDSVIFVDRLGNTTVRDRNRAKGTVGASGRIPATAKDSANYPIIGPGSK